MRHGIDSSSPVLFLVFESDVYASFESDLRGISIGIAAFKIGVHSIMKVCDKFVGGGSLIGDERPNSLPSDSEN